MVILVSDVYYEVDSDLSWLCSWHSFSDTARSLGFGVGAANFGLRSPYGEGLGFPEQLGEQLDAFDPNAIIDFDEETLGAGSLVLDAGIVVAE